jgi:hypothetical protein
VIPIAGGRGGLSSRRARRSTSPYRPTKALPAILRAVREAERRRIRAHWHANVDSTTKGMLEDDPSGEGVTLVVPGIVNFNKLVSGDNVYIQTS